MAARSKARKRALDVLYEADLLGHDVRTTLAARLSRPDPPLPAYAVSLVEGVVERREQLDELITHHAVGWTLERMPPLDRCILRLGLYELLWCDDIPDGVALAEAVELASQLSTEESAKFVNGVLSAARSGRG